ncbi:MAG: hypothetical protein Q8P81_01380 [Nanoarchaeota archaeon]|nr:hypothetical protein [Nanoarchaeota archaeon]
MAKIDLATVSYILGIFSIVLAFFNPGAGLVIGIVGLIHSNKNNVPEAKKLNVIGIVLSLTFLIIGFALAYTCIVNPEALYCQGVF